MKEVTNYRKSKVYSDVEPNIPIATFMEYMGKSGESYCLSLGVAKNHISKEKKQVLEYVLAFLIETECIPFPLLN